MKRPLIKLFNQETFEVDKEKVEANKHIKPLIGGKYLEEEVDLYDEAYTWDPKTHVFKARGLFCEQNIIAFSKFGFHGFFKPSVAEVITCIPDDLIKNIHAFQIVGDTYIGNRCHEFEVSLYKK